MAPPSTETLQSLILNTLASSPSSSIPDSRALQLDGCTLDAPEDQPAVQAALASLQSREMIAYKHHETITHVLTEEGSLLRSSGSHEARVWGALPLEGEGEGLSVAELKSKLGEETTKIGQGRAFKNKWIAKKGDKFVKAVPQITDSIIPVLSTVASTGTLPKELGGDKELADLRKRKLAVQKKTLHFSVEKGPEFATEVKQLETDLTADMLASGAWKTAQFKKYNFAAAGAPPNGGALHPLLKVREEFRNIFFEMGFREMPTNQFVESSFWCFDSLFVPQQHVAREMQDTFYIKEPSTAGDPDPAYFARVKEVHEKGGFGSIGYRAPFSDAEAKKLLLRTHTTAISSACLYELASRAGGWDKPAKLFSIDRVFRNEAVDMTHLAEFHQVEGVVADRNLTLGDLIGFMEVFFAKMGMTKLRFKPAYNPYTEPSLEIFAYHNGLGKWVEIGNSGMFRPEMLLPMGIPEDVRVLGFGLSLERPTMIKYGINNIRDLVGHKVDIEGVEKSAAVRF